MPAIALCGILTLFAATLSCVIDLLVSILILFLYKVAHLLVLPYDLALRVQGHVALLL